MQCLSHVPEKTQSCICSRLRVNSVGWCMVLWECRADSKNACKWPWYMEGKVVRVGRYTEKFVEKEEGEKDLSLWCVTDIKSQSSQITLLFTSSSIYLPLPETSFFGELQGAPSRLWTEREGMEWKSLHVLLGGSVQDRLKSKSVYH